jgi:hypothetical protein
MGAGLQRLNLDDEHGRQPAQLISDRDKARALRHAGADPAMASLRRAIDEFPGIATSGATKGFIDGRRPGEPWEVIFSCEPGPTPEGYASIEFLVWARRELSAAGFSAAVEVNAPPPYLNGPSRSMYFILSGRRGHPDAAAALIRELRSKLFFIPG